ncbi:hypothetical protein IMSAGC019_02257 [Lachnospiraceae bacterium]|nr:hypothetical protein IMSAGC019_02257 [Lachnospiraceae bacterium]
MRKCVISLLSVLIGSAVGGLAVIKREAGKADKAQEQADKYLEMFRIMNQWVQVKQQGKDLVGYFEKENFKKIAIYGMGSVGEALLMELKSSKITVAYGIDKRADSLCADIHIVPIEDFLEEVDAVVVTAVTSYNEIERKLREKMKCPIIPFGEILYEVHYLDCEKRETIVCGAQN